MKFIQENKLLSLLILTTIVKGLVWAFVVPIFQAPDEHRHYATIQHYAQPKDYAPSSYDFPSGDFNFFDIDTHNMSPELRNFVEKIELPKTCFDANGKYSFQDNSSFGLHEEQIRSANLLRFVEKYPPYKTPYSPLYYKTDSYVENFLAEKGISIIERAYLMRLISVIVFSILILVYYFIFKELSFSKTESALLAGILSFQPMLTFICSIINIDSLSFLSFGIFTLGAMKIFKKIDSASVILLISGTILAINTKATGLFLLTALAVLIILYLVCHKIKLLSLSRLAKNKKQLTKLILVILLFSGISFFVFHKLQSHYSSIVSLDVIKKYIQYHLELPISIDRSLSYWGNFGSPNVPISKYYIFAIWAILAFSIIGFLGHIFSCIRKKEIKKNITNRIFFFQIIFLTYILVAFNLMIHFVNIQAANPENFADPFASIGTPGRYFFPTIFAKLTLFIIGFCYFFKKISREKIIFIFLIAMILFNMICLFSYIIPRYYL